MRDPQTGLVLAPAYDHLTGEGHPERPGRVEAIERRLVADGLAPRTAATAAAAHVRGLLADG